MNQKEIIVTVAPNGEITVDAQCFVGADCEKATKFLEDALGKAKSRKLKPERYKKAETKASAGR